MTRCLHSSTKLRASEPGTSEAFKSRAQVGVRAIQRVSTVSLADMKQISKPFSWKALSLFLVTGTGLYYYFQSEKEKIESVKSAFALSPFCRIQLRHLLPTYRTTNSQPESR